MSEPAATSPAAPTGDTSPAEKRWRAIYALVTAWIRPGLTTRRTSRAWLIDAWVVHLVAVGLTMFVLLLFMALERSHYRHDDLPLIVVMSSVIDDVVAEFKAYPAEAAFGLAATTAFVEGGLILLATALMAWGARDEPTADSFRHALRRTWLHSGHVVALIVLLGFIISTLGNISRGYWNSASVVLPQPEPTAPPTGATPQQLAEYNRQTSEYWNEYYTAQNRARPFVVRHEEAIIVNSVILAGVWFFWALLRGLGAERPTRTPEHPPMCRVCGYNLTGLPPDGRCPECGKPVSESIGPEASPGAAWERPAHGGGYLQTLFAWMRSPQALAYDLRLTPVRRRCPTFLAINVIISGLAGGVGVVLIFFLDEFFRGMSLDHEALTIGMPIAAAIWAAFLLLFASSSALVPAMVLLVRDRRNLLSGTFQAACYCSGWLFVWTAAGAATLAVTVLVFEDLIRSFARSVFFPPDLLALLINLAVHAICGIFYVIIVYRASTGVRYACR